MDLFARATAARRFLIFGLSTVGAALGGLGGAAGYVVSYLLLLFSTELRK